MDPTSAHALTSDHAPDAGRRWVEAVADHVRRRFDSRARVWVRIDGPAVELAYVYALEGGGLVLIPAPASAAGATDAEHHAGDEHAVAHASPRSERGTGMAEIWIALPAQAVFEVRRAEDGSLCTGFGYLGLSRTPHLFVARATEPPPPPDHHRHGGY